MLKRNVIVGIAIVLLGLASQINATDVKLQAEQPKIHTEEIKLQANDVLDIYKKVSPLDLVNQASKYLDKKVKMTGKFDKFTAIGLDYAPVNRDAKNHISFMIKRSNVADYNIPLSELKLILKRDYAEKELINIENGDEIEIYGTVFSSALGDPWVDVEKIVILTPKDKKDDTKASDLKNDNKKENEGK